MRGRKKTASGLSFCTGFTCKRALENNNILILQELAKHSEKEILAFHGLGEKLTSETKKALAEIGLAFKID